MIDPVRFEEHFRTFHAFVEGKSGQAFESFAGDPYVVAEEGYKEEVCATGRRLLAVAEWKKSWIGSGRILKAVIAAIEQEENNLVSWKPRWGETRCCVARPVTHRVARRLTRSVPGL